MSRLALKTRCFFIFFLIFTAGCGQVKKQERARIWAIDFLQGFFETVLNRQLEEQMGYYDARMFSGFSKSEWKKHLERTYKKLGNFKKNTFRKWKLRDGALEGISGIIITVQFQSFYENDSNCFETFDVLYSQGAGNQKILAHQLSSIYLNPKKVAR